jgi:hypothetical protein
MTSTPQLTDQAITDMLQDELKKLRSNEITAERANAASNIANSAIRAVTAKVNYQLQRGEKPFTAFFAKEQEA